MATDLARKNAETFNSSASSYDDKPHMVGLADQVAAAVQQKCPVNARTAVLEFGCGTGLISERLAPVTGSVHGTDIASAMVEVFNRKAATKGFSNMKAVCVDVLNNSDREAAIRKGSLPEKFDIILINMTAHHLEDVSKVLGALGKLLLPEGRLILTDLLATDRSKNFHGKKAHHSVSHYGGFSEDQVCEMISEAGLQLFEFDTDSLHITKSVEQSDGSEKPEDFEVFLAIAGKR